MKYSDLPLHVQKLIQEAPTDYRVAGLRPEVAQPDQRREGQAGQLEGGEECRGFRIQFICFRRRLLDQHDNLPMSCKQITDRITERLGFKSDNDPNLQWEYHQIKTTGKEGVIVVIEPL